MSKLKSLLLSGIGAVAVAAVAIGGTLAYLQDDDSDVNVMTLGNVQIDQLEYERVVDQDGNWVPLTTTDKYGYTPDELQDYTQDKPLYPAVFADGSIKWDDRNGSQEVSGPTSHQQSWAQIGASGSNQLFDDSVKNALDKFVFVKNTGKSDAYVRTWFAFEQGSVAADNFANVIMTNSNCDHWSWETVATDVDIDGNRYVVKLATYLGPKSNPTGVLAPGAVSYPSLLQVYMKPEATNEDCAAIDGNKNGTYDILSYSQAVQTNGFENANAALSEAFGLTHPWSATAPVIPAVVESEEELVTALNDGGAVLLNADIVLDDTVNITKKTNVDLNGHTLTVSRLEAKEDTSISGGSVVHGKNTYPALSVSAGTLTLNDVKVVCEEPCNIVTSGSAQAAEYAALEVWSGKCVLNNCDLVANATVKRYSNSIFAIGIHEGELTMNGGSITVTSAGSDKAQYNYEGVLFAGSAPDKVVTLNNVAINYNQTNGKFLFAWGGNTVVNTTDAAGKWDSSVNVRSGATYTFNYQ